MVGDDARDLNQRWFRPITGLLLVSTLALAGCGQDAGAESQPESTADSSGEPDEAGQEDEEDEGPAEEPTPQPASSEGPGENLPVPEAPEEVYEDDLDGAEAALRHWWDLFRYTRETGTFEAIDEFTHEDCWPCETHFEKVEETYDLNGWYVHHDPYEIELVELTHLDTGAVGGPFTLLEGDYDGYLDGEYKQSMEGAQEAIWTARLIFDDEVWQVASLRFEQPSEEGAEDEARDS